MLEYRFRASLQGIDWRYAGLTADKFRPSEQSKSFVNSEGIPRGYSIAATSTGER